MSLPALQGYPNKHEIVVSSVFKSKNSCGKRICNSNSYWVEFFQKEALYSNVRFLLMESPSLNTQITTFMLSTTIQIRSITKWL